MDEKRIKREELEKLMLSEYAARSAESKGRAAAEEECPVRTVYQRDVDRIIHSKAFRRLMHKTQVFLQPEGDHYRTRLTHTLEVSRIARTIARGLMLNEDLTEAISLGHDLGHTPFGHAGERALNEIMSGDGGFRHYEQSLRVVDVLEKDGRGLNLTWEVRDGILRHTNDPLAATLEGQTVRLADRIAYMNHDLDDAVRAGILTEQELPPEIICALGDRYSQRINTLIEDVIDASTDKNTVSFSPQMNFTVSCFHDFMNSRVYRNPMAKSEESKVQGLIEGIFFYYIKNKDKLPEEYRSIMEKTGPRRAVCDYVSGMTDKYAIACYSDIFLPMSWQVK